MELAVCRGGGPESLRGNGQHERKPVRKYKSGVFEELRRISSVALVQAACMRGLREEAWEIMKPERHYDGTSSNVGVPI